MKVDTKQKILLAAIKIFSRKGYRAATVREIGLEAGAANLSAIAYHFNGKENLYKAVLEFMFEDAQKFIPQENAEAVKEMAPEEKLRIFILTMMRVIYVIDTQLDADLASIFSKEIANPSPFLGDMVHKYVVPSSEALQSLLIDIIGQEVPAEVLRNCGESIMGQIYYYLFAWPLIIRANPDHPETHTQIDALADHIYRFTLGGLDAIKKSQVQEAD